MSLTAKRAAKSISPFKNAAQWKPGAVSMTAKTILPWRHLARDCIERQGGKLFEFGTVARILRSTVHSVRKVNKYALMAVSWHAYDLIYPGWSGGTWGEEGRVGGVELVPPGDDTLVTLTVWFTWGEDSEVKCEIFTRRKSIYVCKNFNQIGKFIDVLIIILAWKHSRKKTLYQNRFLWRAEPRSERVS